MNKAYARPSRAVTPRCLSRSLAYTGLSGSTALTWSLSIDHTANAVVQLESLPPKIDVDLWTPVPASKPTTPAP